MAFCCRFPFRLASSLKLEIITVKDFENKLDLIGPDLVHSYCMGHVWRHETALGWGSSRKVECVQYYEWEPAERVFASFR